MLINEFNLNRKMLLQHLNTDKVKELARLFEIENDYFMIYLIILQNQPLTVAKVATHLEIDRGKTYRAVHKLQDLGYVTETISNPILVSAIDPKDVLKILATKHKNDVIECENIDYSEFFEDIQRKDRKASIVKTSYISGVDNYLSKMKHMFDNCKFAKMYLSQNTLKRIYYTEVTEVIKKDKKKFTIFASNLTLVKRLHPGKQKKIAKDVMPDHDIVITDKGVLFDVGPMDTGALLRTFYYNHSDTNFMYTTNSFLMFIASTYLDGLDAKN